MYVTAIVVAAGRGKRMGQPLPKQYLPLNGVPILVHVLRAFEAAASVQEVLLVVPPGDEDDCLEKIVEAHGLHKVLKIVVGGKHRQDSVRHGLEKVEPETDVVIVHDGVRPFVTPDLVHRALEALPGADGVVPGLPVRETVKEVEDGGWVVRTLDRDRLRVIQTPQAFRREMLEVAHHHALSEGFEATDDAVLVERVGGKVRWIPGDPHNLKITTPEDLLMAECLLKIRERSAPVQEKGRHGSSRSDSG